MPTASAAVAAARRTPSASVPTASSRRSARPALRPSESPAACAHAPTHRPRDLRRRTDGCQVRIGIATREIDAVAQEVEEGRCQFRCARRAKSDRVGRAGIERDAVVRILRRKVEEIAGASTASCSGVKRRRIFNGNRGLQREVVLPAVTPAAPAEALQQEHVVGIEMRPHAAARRGVAHHQVVEPRERQEREAPQQCIGGRQDQVHALDQQRPVAGRQRLKSARRNGPCANDQRAPSRATSRDSTSSRHASASARGNRPANPGIASPHEQCVLVPVAREERGRPAPPSRASVSPQPRGRRSRKSRAPLARAPSQGAIRAGASRRAMIRLARRVAPPRWATIARRIAQHRAVLRTATRCPRIPTFLASTADEHLRQHGRDAHLRALRFRRVAARGHATSPSRTCTAGIRECCRGWRRRSNRQEGRRCGVGGCRARRWLRRLRSGAREDRARRAACRPRSRSACSSRRTRARRRARQRHRVHGHRHRGRQGRARRQPSLGRQAAALRLPDPRRAAGDGRGDRARPRARRRRASPLRSGRIGRRVRGIPIQRFDRAAPAASSS